MGSDISKEQRQREDDACYRMVNSLRQRHREAANRPAPPDAGIRRQEEDSFVRHVIEKQKIRKESQEKRQQTLEISPVIPVASTNLRRHNDVMMAAVEPVIHYSADQLHAMSVAARPTLYPDLRHAVDSINRPEPLSRLDNKVTDQTAKGSPSFKPAQKKTAPNESATSLQNINSQSQSGSDELAKFPSQIDHNATQRQTKTGATFASKNTINHPVPSTSGARCMSPAPLKTVGDDFVKIKYFSKNQSVPSAPQKQGKCLRKSRATNRPGQEQESSEEQCASCEQPFGLEIYQCADGHSVCEQCRSSGARCRCGEKVQSMRNFLLEGHIRENIVACPNTRDGCSMRPRRSKLEDHLRECIYRDMDCPLATVYGLCTWRGKRGDDMVRHFDERHPVHRQAAVNREMLLRRLDRDDRIVHLIQLDGYIFLIHIKILESSQTLLMAVQLLSTRSGASQWTYEINMYNKDESRRKMAYHDACTSDCDAIDGVFAQARCLVLPLAYVRGLACKGRSVAYKFFITRGAERPRGVRARGGKAARGGRGKSR